RDARPARRPRRGSRAPSAPPSRWSSGPPCHPLSIASVTLRVYVVPRTQSTRARLRERSMDPHYAGGPVDHAATIHPLAVERHHPPPGGTARQEPAAPRAPHTNQRVQDRLVGRLLEGLTAVTHAPRDLVGHHHPHDCLAHAGGGHGTGPV